MQGDRVPPKKDKPVMGSAYFCSCLFIPIFTSVVLVASRLISVYWARAAGPGYTSGFTPSSFALLLLFSVLLAAIGVILIVPPRRIDSFFRWWVGRE